MNILILTTSLGSGHVGMSQELVRMLEAEGHTATEVDYLDLLPLHAGSAVRSSYRAQLRYVPNSYERSYGHYHRFRKAFAAINARASEKRLVALLRTQSFDAVVANNPHAIMALGRLRETGAITVPAFAYVTDFGVHSLWVHDGLDAVFVHHSSAVNQVTALGVASVSLVEPVVAPEFSSTTNSEALRKLFGIEENEVAALISAGSWGLGEVKATTMELADTAGIKPIVLCGRNEALRLSLQRESSAVALSWVADMAQLMASIDVLIDNSGGLTSLQALAAGKQVIHYRPIAGHGRHNAEVMSGAGVTRYVHSAAELRAAVSQVLMATPPASAGFGTLSLVRALEAALPTHVDAATQR